MGKPRIELHNVLLDICPNVYFQPPESVRLKYPCIVYSRSSGVTSFANNFPYHFEDSYTITVMDRNPDSEIPLKIAMLPKCSKERHYTADNIHHDVFLKYH